MSAGQLTIFGCGGCGMNIVSKYTEAKHDADAASIITHFIDTSKSNIKPNMKEDDIYIIPDVDGSGKIRAENASEIANLTKDMLVKHKPGDFNLVVFSLSGGSGSVIGPLIIGELLAKGLPVVAIVIGTDESVTTANNTLKTLKTLDGVSKTNNKPLITIYEHHDRGLVRSAVDERIHSYIAMMSYLVAARNTPDTELDSQDLINWLDFTRTTSLKPQVALLDVYSESEHVVAKHPTPVSVASIYHSRDNLGLGVVPEYQCAGYFDLSEMKVKELHYVIDTYEVPNIAKRIEHTLKTQREVADSRPKQTGFLSSSDNVDDKGMVL